MKNIYSLFIICVLSYSQLLAQPSPLVELNFNNNLKDSQGTVKGITAKKTRFTTDRYGQANKAIQFDGVNAFVKVPYNINPSVLPELTVLMWVKADTANKNMCFLSQDDGGFDRTLSVTETKWSLYCGIEAILFGPSIKKGEWTFVAATFNQAKSQMTLFINGETTTLSSTNEDGLPYFHLGNNPTFNAYFLGAIDDVRVYNKVLTSGNISKIYKKEREGMVNNEN